MSYYVFSLPPGLLDALVPRNLLGSLPLRASDPDPDPIPKKQSPAAGSKTCAICLNASFLDVDDQRAHFRSDWHRYNVKLRLTGVDAVTELEFASLVEGLEDSLSGSASSSDDGNSSDPDAVRTLLAKPGNAARTSSPTSEAPRAPRTALTWFHSPPSTQIGVYNAIFPARVPQTSYLSALKDLQHSGPYGRRWTMLMVAGGHFAGVVVQVRRPDTDGSDDIVSGGKKKPKKPKPEVEVLRHKTFHRYTTRRKQGGSQSVNDNAKGPAKSAGAQLRRYGEQALRDDIRALLADWAEDVASSELIWLRASVSNKRIFYDYDDAVFHKGDERLRNFPFPTRRPTQAELTRCLNELTRVKTSHLTEEALHAQDEAYIASLPKPKAVPTLAPARTPSPKPVVPRLSKEEEDLRDKWRRLIEMATKSRIEPFKTLWDREGEILGGIDTRVPERGATILQLVVLAGQEDMVRYLLEDLRADPTITVAEGADAEADTEDTGNASDTSDAPPPISVTSRRTAYDLARTRGVRNVFRRCAAAHPDWWDWLGTGRIPSVLSREMEEEREERRKGRRRGLKEKLRERQAKQEEAAPQPIVQSAPVPTEKRRDTGDGPRRLGGAAGQQEGVAGLSAEMRAKVERERRARAAEARLKSLGDR